MTRFRKGDAGRWEGIDPEPYDAGGSDDPEAPFRGVSRQRLFGPEEGLDAALRYFEVEPGGWTALERHRHAHAVVVVRGRGAALVAPEVREVAPFDLVRVPPGTWHQLRAADDAPLGFLCLVDAERDRPERAGPDDVEALRADPRVAAFLRP